VSDVEFVPLDAEELSPRPAAEEQKLTMRDPSGAVYRVPLSSVDDAESKGWSYADAGAVQQARTGEAVAADPIMQLGAFATGALEGVSAGASSPLIAGAVSLTPGVTWDEARAGVQGLKRDAPLAAGAGQVAGALGGAYLTGGASLAAEGSLAARMGGGLAARAAAGAAVGAGEGALQGGLYGLSQTLLDDGELTAERLVAAAGRGALFGASVGGLAGGVLPVAGSLTGKAARAVVGGKKVGEAATELSRWGTIQAMGARVTDWKRLGARAESVADRVRNYTFKDGPRKGQQLLNATARTEDLVEPLEAAVAESSARLGALKTKVDEASRTTPELAPNALQIRERIESEVLAPLRKSMVDSDHRAAASVERELSRFDERITDAAQPPLTWSEVDEVRNALYQVTHKKPPGGGIATVPEAAQELDDVQRILSDEVKKAGEKTLLAVGDAEGAASFREGYRELSELLTARDLVTKNTAHEKAMMPFGLTSTITGAAGLGSGIGAMMSGNIGGALFGPAAAIAHKVVRDRGSSTLAVMARAIEQQGTRLDKAVGALARVKSVPRTAARAAVAQSTKEREDTFRERFKEAQQARLAGPRGKVERASRLAEPLVDEYPRLASQVAAKAAANMDLALARLPSGVTGRGLQQHLEEPIVPAADQIRFLDYTAGLEDPVGVIEDVASGAVNIDAIDAVKEAYPRIWEATRKELMTRIADLEEPLAYDSLPALALAFDLEADSRSHGESIAAMQAALAAKENEGGEIDPAVAQQARTQADQLGAPA
jgi:hypothetical protein